MKVPLTSADFLARAATVLDPDTGPVPLDDHLRELYLAENDRFGHEGLRSFKAGWATTETPLSYTTLGAPAQQRGSAAARALGVVIRHSPEVVCKQLGELLYRYAA